MRYAIRVLGREKTFAAFAILTLALGIGAVTTIFSIVDSVLLEPLAYKDPGRLYAASESVAKFAHVYPDLPVNGSHFWSWQKQCRSCESGALLNPATFNLTGSGEPEVVDGATCTWPVFQVLGVKRELGRTFEASDDQPNANRFVVISDSLWRRRLGAGSPCNRQNDSDRRGAECCCRGTASGFPLPVRRRARPIKSVSQARGDLQANGI